MSNGGSGMLLSHISMNLKSKWSNKCEEYWSNPWHFLSPSKAALVSLFPSHLFSLLFTFCVEEAASCKRDRLSKSISSKPKLDHSNLAKAARQHSWGYALYMPLLCLRVHRETIPLWFLSLCVRVHGRASATWFHRWRKDHLGALIYFFVSGVC
jgi:hypothetical protein